MPRLPENWPSAALPRLMNREIAAAYCGVSPGTFDAQVEDGTYPAPLPSDGHRNVLWDREELDAAITARRLNATPVPNGNKGATPSRKDWLADYRQ
ncbi:hypothetical protein [Telmatospirillum sp.]|uniref:helix-turn-helix transcriptional regulator n=1 Tax=Telmatospirillum sp. TaxID=2079197 RepID=UPI00284F0717|nr:hypothetical protein [Telmatospirillum sp.]MDR3438997.1 hypothetical protein [Telmatospirillum sp.]